MGAAARRRAAFNARAAQLAAPQEPAWGARGGAHGPGMAGANGLAAQQGPDWEGPGARGPPGCACASARPRRRRRQ